MDQVDKLLESSSCLLPSESSIFFVSPVVSEVTNQQQSVYLALKSIVTWMSGSTNSNTGVLPLNGFSGDVKHKEMHDGEDQRRATAR